MILQQQLRQGVDSLGLSVSATTEKKLLDFIVLLMKWNRTYNLTAIRDPAEMVTHHLLDSLSVVPALEGAKSLIDVGSGAGLPGLPLSMVLPDLEIASVEASQKKAAFQQQAKIELHLPNVSICSLRIEDYKPVLLPDGVISRAFSSLAGFIKAAGHLVGVNGKLIAMKGKRPSDEMAALPAGWGVASEQPLSVPGLDAERFLVVLKRV